SICFYFYCFYFGLSFRRFRSMRKLRFQNLNFCGSEIRQGVEVGLPQATPLLSEQPDSLQLSHVLADHVLARLHIVAEAPIAREATLLLPGVAQEDRVEELGVATQVSSVEDLLRDLDEPVLERLVLKDEGVWL